MYFGGSALASRSSSEPGSSSGRPSFRIRAVLSFASCTFGWSNGLIPSAQPATAVANSAKKKMRPRSPAPPLNDSVAVGCPARPSASIFASMSSSGSSSLRRYANTRSSP